MTRLLVFTIVVAAAGISVSAHHSYSVYDTDRIMEVQGVLEEFAWVAPHSLITVKDEDGRLYIFECQAPFPLQRRGVQHYTLKKGDRLVLTGNPHRNFDENRILNFKSIRRPADGWKWPNW